MRQDKAYYLKSVELALLLSLKGVKELYGFRMEQADAPDTETVYRAVFALEQQRLITVDAAKRIVMAPDVDRLTDAIAGAEQMLLYTSRDPGRPQQCIYVGSGAVMVTPGGTHNDMHRIRQIPREELAGELWEQGFRIDELLSDECLYSAEELDLPEQAARAAHLLDEADVRMEDAAWDGITDCLRLYRLRDRTCIRQYVLMRDTLRDYFAAADREGSRIYPYSRRIVVDTLQKEI